MSDLVVHFWPMPFVTDAHGNAETACGLITDGRKKKATAFNSAVTCSTCLTCIEPANKRNLQ